MPTRLFVFTVNLMSNPTPSPKYKRIILKISGEALREHGSRDTISPKIASNIARQIREVHDLGV